MFRLVCIVSLTVASTVCWHSRSFAQGTDVQDRLDLFAPEPTAPEPPSKTVIVRRKIPARYKTTFDDPGDEKKVEILGKMGLLDAPQIATFREKIEKGSQKEKDEINARWIAAGRPGRVRSQTLVARAKVIKEKEVKLKKPELKLFLPNAANFTSNAFGTRTNEIADRNVVFSPRLSYSLPLTKFDELAFELTSVSTRFDQSKALENDVLVGSVKFSHFFEPGFGMARFFQGDMKESISAGLETNSSFQPGYEGSADNALIPSLGWALSGIAIGNAKCGKAQCFTAGLGAFADFTVTDYNDSDNFSFGGNASLTWTPGPKGLSLTLSASLRERLYDRLPVERDDLIGKYAAEIKWVANSGITLSGRIEYANRSSTLSTADYDIYIARPTFLLTMPLN